MQRILHCNLQIQQVTNKRIEIYQCFFPIVSQIVILRFIGQVEITLSLSLAEEMESASE